MIGKDKNRTQECNQAQCPFVNDPCNPRRYVCLKCGFERHLDQKDHYDDDWTPFLLIFISVVFIVILMQ